MLITVHVGVLRRPPEIVLSLAQGLELLTYFFAITWTRLLAGTMFVLSLVSEGNKQRPLLIKCGIALDIRIFAQFPQVQLRWEHRWLALVGIS